MSPVPMLQIAMDYITLPPALAMAVKVASEVDIIEIGTPLCKAAGLEAIRSMREIVPDKLILADFKSPDVGGLEAKMAFDAGADMMTVIGGAALALKGESAPAEAHAAEYATRLLGGHLRKLIPVTLPGVVEDRYLVVIDKVAATPNAYPRRVGVPSKHPLQAEIQVKS